MKINSDAFKRRLINVLLTVSGSLLISFASGALIIPNKLVVGGMSGLSILLNSAVRIGEDAWIMLLSISLFLFGLFALGGSFILKTLIETVVYPLGVSFFVRYLAPLTQNLIDELFAALFGGAITGLGASLAFLGGGSTGGVDVIAVALSRLSHKLRPPVVIFAIDALVILLGMAIYRDLSLAALGILSAAVSALVIEKVFCS